MNLINTFLLLLCIATASFAQDYKYETSEAIDVSLAGWNKVLLMPNGNTLFFHFENRKGIIVKVFDKEHKEIASLKHITKILDINALDRSFLDCIEEINGNAALFVTQQIENRETTLRIDIDAGTGKLLKEEKVIQSASFQKKTVTKFLKGKNADDYCIGYAEKKAGFEEVHAGIKHYNNKHELVKDVPVNIDQKGFDKVSMEKMLVNDNGDIMICLELSKIIQYPDRWNRTYVMGYLPKGGDNFMYKKIELSSPWNYYNLHFTHNNFAHSLNVLFSGTSMGILQNGLSRDIASITEQALLVINDDFSAAIFTALKNKKINELIKTTIDAGFILNAGVDRMYTNKYGLSTIVYRGVSEPAAAMGNLQVRNYRPNISFTQFDDKGQEIWANIIPKARLRNYDNDYPNVFHYTSADDIRNVNSFFTKNNCYVFYNDVDEYYTRTLAESNDSVYNVNYTNAICYKLNRKKEGTKSYMFGKLSDDEFKQLYVGSEDFNEETGEYATVFLHKQGDGKQTKIAWVHFEQ